MLLEKFKRSYLLNVCFVDYNCSSRWISFMYIMSDNCVQIEWSTVSSLLFVLNPSQWHYQSRWWQLHLQEDAIWCSSLLYLKSTTTKKITKLRMVIHYLVIVRFRVKPRASWNTSVYGVSRCIKKCPYSEFFWSRFSHICTEYRELFCKSQCSVVKMQTRKTPNTGIFYAVSLVCIFPLNPF